MARAAERRHSRHRTLPRLDTIDEEAAGAFSDDALAPDAQRGSRRGTSRIRDFLRDASAPRRRSELVV